MTKYFTSRTIPTGSIKLTRKDAPTAVVYAHQVNGKFYARAYQGKRNKPDWHYSFRNQTQLEKSVKEFFDGVKSSADYKQTREEAKRAATATGKGFEVGDVVEYSWGYGQTNWDFFQVIRRTARTVTIQAVRIESEGEGWCRDKVTPRRDQFQESEPAMTKLEQFIGSGQPYLSMDFGSATKYDGGARHATSYA